MCVALGRLAVGRPTRMADSSMPIQRLLLEPLFKVLELAFGAPPIQVIAFERGDARRIVAAVFQAFQGIDELLGNRSASQYPDDSAHPRNSLNRRERFKSVALS